MALSEFYTSDMLFNNHSLLFNKNAILLSSDPTKAILLE